jgi:Peptidase family M23
MFLAGRKGKRAGKQALRWHAGVDLFANIKDVVVACEDGTIVDFSFFYNAKSGQRTYKLLIQHDGSGVVVNYGEVTGDSLRNNGLKVGKRVAAGQPIGFVSDTSMLHFETYIKGTTTSHRWWKDEKTPPRQLLNPTRYLLFLREHGLSSTQDAGTQPELEEMYAPEAEGLHEIEYEYERDSEERHQVHHAFEGGPGMIAKPGFGELYSDSTYPASNQSDDREVSDKPTADAFVADGDGKRYFDTFPQLGDLTVKKATILTPSNFENLMDIMLASNQKSFVIDAHGTPEGLTMPLTSATTISATKDSLFILSGVERIQSLIRTAKESDTFWGRASGTDLERWRRIVEILHSKTWQQMVDGWPEITPQVSNVDAAKSIVQSRINSLVDSLFPGSIANKYGRVDKLIKRMLRLQAKGIHEIQFRACNIGKDSNSLHEFRRFFGADHLCAPDVRSGIGLSNLPSIDRRAVDLLGRDHRTQLFHLPSGRFAIRIIISGLSFGVRCAADTQAAVGEWVASHIMPNSTYRRGRLPIHFLATEPPVFSLDSDYAAHIKCRSSFWEGVVRGSEKHRQEIEAHEERETHLAE